jgi:hypothetical protein
VTVKYFQKFPPTLDDYVKKTSLIFCDPKSLPVHQKFNLTYSPNSFYAYLFFIDDENFDLTSFATNPDTKLGSLDHYSYFLVDGKKSLVLKTFEWWTEVACNELQLVELNTFDKKTSKWRQNLNIQEKFLNFYNCSIKTVTLAFFISLTEIVRKSGYYNFPPYFPKVFIMLERYDMEVIVIIAKQGNFTIVRPPTPTLGYELEVTGNGDVNTDLTFFFRSFTYRFDRWYCCDKFFDHHLTAMHSPPLPYTNFEKMFLPFDADTWMYLGITFGVAFVTIFFMNFLPRFVRDVIYGRGVNSPTFNMVGAFFGMGQTVEPDSSFGRMILMGFILFCLVFRTAYQGEC